ncbi:MAG: PspA/IM30 family protein, partial [Mycobacterium sp.]
GRMLEVEQAGVQAAGHSRLEQIRASMRGEALPTGGTPATEATPAPAETTGGTVAEKPFGQ